MTVINQDYELVAGEDKTITVPVTDINGVAINLTGASLEWSVKTAMDAASDSITLTTGTSPGGIVVAAPTSGVAVITLASASTSALLGGYYHDLRVLDSATHKTTVLKGKVIITNSVS